MKPNFLFELGSEELPAGQLEALAQHLEQAMDKALSQHKIGFGCIKSFYTPRRLAVLIEDLQLEIPAQRLERKGPAKIAGFDAAGQPTKALEGFLKSAGASVDQLIEVETEKGTWLAVRLEQPAVAVETLLPTFLQDALKTLPLKKSMRWGAGSDVFLRPVLWMVALLGEAVLPFRYFGLEAGRKTYGHRFHHPEALLLSHAENYVVELKAAHVMVDPTARREHIIQATKALLPEGVEAQMRTLDEVVNLVEWPVPLLCQFDPAFLRVPEQALIATMEANQRVFPVRNLATGALQPCFVTIANLESKAPAEVIKGNEKVVGARLSDARFFYEEDLKTPLDAHGEALKKITFQQGLGSLLDKTERLMQNALSPRAAQLCKCDLVTQMVQEFPELQGYMGHQYALLQGEDPQVAAAIENHYKPKGRGAALPEGVFGIDLAILDKIDTLVGLFAIGKEPTSSGDPYALRRQALGVIAILVENHMTVDLMRYLQNSAQAYQQQNPDWPSSQPVLQKLRHFLEERLEVWCREEKALPAAIVRAVLNCHTKPIFDPFALFEQMNALRQLLETAEGRDLKELAKRVANILDANVPLQLPDAALFSPAEQALWQVFEQAEQQNWLQLMPLPQRYRQFLSFKEPLARFFETVRVNDAEAALRQNRQLLLKQIQNSLFSLTDFSVL